MKKITIFLLSALILSVAIPVMATRSPKNAIARNLDVFNAIVRELQTTYVDTIDADKTIQYAINSMLASFDPYTEYFTQEQQADFETVSSGEYSGIGSVIMQRPDKNVYISDPNYGGPAQLAGLRPGDRIVSVNGDTVLGKTTSEVSKLLRGQPGSQLTLVINRPYVGADSVIEVTLTRANIAVATLPYYGVVGDKLGYISLTTFNEKSAQAVRDALIELKKDPRVEAIVLDLRDNGGGLLESAVKIVGLFVPKGTEVIRYRGRDLEHEKIFKTTQAPIDTEIPLMVLVDDGTASSSEIVAGSLQDLDRALIIGNRSFGKGLVQSTRPLPYDGLLKVTIAKYYIPSGRLIQALDYSHRNADGSPGHVPDSLANVFYTKNGREVRDGGGITPEIKVDYGTLNMVTYTVANDLWAFDYANRFYATTPAERMPSKEQFVVTDSIFEDFAKFIDPAKFKYDRLSDSSIERLRESLRLEGYLTDSVQAQISALEGLLKRDVQHDLNLNRKQLDQILGREIAKRYYFNAGEILQQLRDDAAIDSAMVVINTPGRYQSLLAAPAAPIKKK